MQKQTVVGFGSSPFGEAALAASRKVWLAGLGATAVTRDWVESKGGHFFRTLVKQGAVVESRAIRYLGDQVETSLTQADTMWRNTRRTVEATVKQAATTVGGTGVRAAALDTRPSPATCRSGCAVRVMAPSSFASPSCPPGVASHRSTQVR